MGLSKQRWLNFQPGPAFVNQALKALKIPVSVWAIIGLLATLLTAGVLRLGASDLQQESFRFDCNLRAQVRALRPFLEPLT